jgi:hypothetical protein
MTGNTSIAIMVPTRNRPERPARSGLLAILDRQTLTIVGSFGRMGKGAGEFSSVPGTPDPHYTASGSKGNLYTAGGIPRPEIRLQRNREDCR